MYNEGKNTFVRDTVIKILLVLLFVFLLIWLFPMPNLNPFYDRIFAENIKSMKEVAKSYYTIERLPKNIGDKEKLTLQEMLDKKMIIPFVDKDGKSCDPINSYVEVVKMDTEYLFKTNLSCSGKTDYVVDYFGCYDICKDNSCNTCQKDVTEYEFKKTVDTKYVDHYVCPVGYILSGKTCVKTVENTDTKPATISCKSGYKYNDNNNKCEKTVTDEVNANPVCPSGFVYNSTSKKCLKSTGETVDANPSCVAFPGYEYNSTSKKCEKPVTVTEEGSPYCLTGYTYNTINKLCERIVNDQVNGNPVCASGYTYNPATGKCTDSNTTTHAMCSTGYTYNAARNICEKPITLTCGTTQVGAGTYTNWACYYKTYTSTQSKTSTLTFTRAYISTTYGLPGCVGTACDIAYYKYEECRRSENMKTVCVDSSYTLNSNGTCTKASTTTQTAASCSGTVSGSTCTVTTTSTQNPTYSCPSGYTPSGSVCYRSSLEQRTPEYSCPAEYTRNGSSCSKTTTDSKTPNYTCPSGYTQNGTVCNKTTNEEKDATYTCPKGTPKTGDPTKCIISSIDQEDSYYGCPTTYILSGKTCYKTSKSDDKKDAEAIYKNKTVTQYTWSKSSTLAGWIATGKTRTTKVACDQ